MMGQLREKWYQKLPIRSLLIILKKITLPGFEGVSIYEVLRLYINGIRESSLTDRAASVSFHFFLGIFPAFIFLFTLIPYLPVPDLQRHVLDTFKGILPDDVFSAVKRSLISILHQRKAGLMSITFFVSLWVASNGFQGLLRAFKASAFHEKTYKIWQMRLISIGLTLVFFLTLIILGFMQNVDWVSLWGWHFPEFIQKSWPWIRQGLQFFLLYAFISLILLVGSGKGNRKGFFSAGATTATLFMLLFSWGFSIYVKHFHSYNEVYGALGAIPLFLTWLFLSALAVLIGYELNLSIRFAKRKKAGSFFERLKELGNDA